MHTTEAQMLSDYSLAQQLHLLLGRTPVGTMAVVLEAARRLSRPANAHHQSSRVFHLNPNDIPTLRADALRA